MQFFNPHAEHAARAVQAWQILTGKAMNRQMVTYLDLSRLMFGKDAAGVLANILGHIAFYCIHHGLPPLTSVVVGKRRGTPGESIPIEHAMINGGREKVYEYDWFNVYPPSETTLRTANERGMSREA